MRPKVSICIPTYNQKPEYLRECVQSALQQRYDPLEVVVSENHSTNEAPAVLSEFADARLRVVRPPTHLGMVSNFAFSASQATGDYLNFLSSDDLLHPDFSGRMAEMLEAHRNLAFAHSAVALIKKDGQVAGYERSIHPVFVRPGVQELQRYIWGQRNVFIAVLMRRTAYEAAGGWPTGLDTVADWYLSLRLLAVGDVAHCSDVLACYRNWSNPRWCRQYLAWVREVRELYERIESSDMVALIDGKTATLHKARKRCAVHMVGSLAALDLPATELAQAVGEIVALSDSWAVRTRLSLVQAGLGPLFSARRRGQEWLRQHVKAFLYPRPSGDSASWRRKTLECEGKPLS
jgi:glycosyltransferase involved in cell wall biosynthesis